MLSCGCSQAALPESSDEHATSALREPSFGESLPVGDIDNSAGLFGCSERFARLLASREKLSDADFIEALEQTVAGSVPPAERAMASYLLGRLYEKKDIDSKQMAFRMYEQASVYKPFTVLARIKAANLALELGKEEEAKRYLEELIPIAGSVARNREKPSGAGASGTASTSKVVLRGLVDAGEHGLQNEKFLARGIYLLGERQSQAGDIDGCAKSMSLVKSIFPSTEYSRGADYHLGRIALERDGDGEKAASYFRAYLKHSPGGRRAVEICRIMIAGGSESGVVSGAKSVGGRDAERMAPSILPGNRLLPSLGSSDKSLIAYAYYKAGLWQEALEMWRVCGDTHILRAVCLSKLNQKPAAAQALLQAVKLNPRDPLISSTTSMLCIPLSTAEAISLWKQVLSLNPVCLDDALYNVAKRSGTSGMPFYRRLLEQFPGSTHVPESAWWMFWYEMKAAYNSSGPARVARLRTAIALADAGLKVIPATNPVSSRLAFWRAKALELSGSRAAALESYAHAASSYPGDYYSFRSRQRHAHLSSQAQSSAASTGKTIKPIADRKWHFYAERRSPKLDWSWPSPPALFGWQEARAKMGETASALAWLGLYSESLDALPGVISPEMKTWLYLGDNNRMSALGTASYNLAGKPRESKLWELAYPLAYAGSIDAQCRRWKLDPLLIHGLIRQESRYDAGARSRSNAMGLMQLLEGTALGVAKNNSIVLTKKAEIYNPETNIQLGCAYLAYVLRRHEGNAMFAVASYNGGPNAVAKWKKRYLEAGMTDLDAFVEDIPYNETRDYVRKVFSHYWNYENIYL